MNFFLVECWVLANQSVLYGKLCGSFGGGGTHLSREHICETRGTPKCGGAESHWFVARKKKKEQALHTLIHLRLTAEI